MKDMKNIFLILVTISLLMSKSWAAELTLRDCLNMATAYNDGFKASEMNVLSEEQEVKIHRKNFFQVIRR